MSRRLFPLEEDERWSDAAELMLDSYPKPLRAGSFDSLGKVFIREYLRRLGDDEKYAPVILGAFTGSSTAKIRTILAEDFNIGWFNAEFDEETQQKIFAEAFAAKRTEGTAGALKKAVTSVFGNCEIKEWFDSDYSETGPGEPFHYKIRVVSDTASAENLRKLKMMVGIFADARSICDSVEIAPPKDSAAELSTVFATGIVEGCIDRFEMRIADSG